MQAAAEEFKALGMIPFAGFCSDPCDGRTQGTPGMMDSLAYRNGRRNDFSDGSSGPCRRAKG